MTNPELREKIQQTYIIGYVKDVVLPRALDDATFQTLQSIIIFNHMDVLQELQKDEVYLKAVFDKAADLPPDDPLWPDIVAFIMELCLLAKSLQQQSRLQLFQHLISLGLFHRLTKLLYIGSDELKAKAADTLALCANQEPQKLR